MAVNYTSLAATALRLLTENGQIVQHRRVIRGPYNPATGSTTEAIVDTPRYAAVFPYRAGDTTIRGNQIQQADRQVTMDGAEPVILGDRLVIGGAEYEIISLAAQNPSGLALYYDIHARGPG